LLDSLDSLAGPGNSRWILSLLTLDPPSELSVHLLAGFARCSRWIHSLDVRDSLAPLAGFSGFTRWICRDPSRLSLNSLADESIGTMRNRDNGAVDDLDMENMELSGGMMIYSMR